MAQFGVDLGLVAEFQEDDELGPSPPGNTISRYLAKGRAFTQPRFPLPDRIIVLYGRVIHLREDYVQGSGLCSVATLGELMSPNLNALLSAGGLDFPIPGKHTDLNQRSVIKFTGVVRSSKEGRIALVAARAITIVRGRELNLYEALAFHSPPFTQPLLQLNWVVPFVYASKIQAEAQKVRADKERVRLIEDKERQRKARRAAATAGSTQLRVPVIMPKVGGIVFEPPVKPRPKLR